MIQNNHETIEKAIKNTLNGNPDAYTTIVMTYMQKLYTKALCMTKNKMTAEDLVQETFIDGYLHLYDLKDHEKLESWLMRILTNKTFNHLARSRKTEPEEVLCSLPDKRSPELLCENAESLREWKKKLFSLPEAQKEVAILYFFTELTMEEIAKKTKLPLGTVKRRIHDARKTLRKEILMTEKEKLPDSFAIELSKKIRDLENYTSTYGNIGFDDAYRNVKTLIANLSDAENVEKYSVESAKIASLADMFRYQDEALAVFRKYGDVKKASELMDRIRYKRDGGMNNAWQYDYTKNKIIPELLRYPESEDRALELGAHYEMITEYIDKSTEAGIREAEEFLRLSLLEFEKTSKVSSYHGAAHATMNALQFLSDNRESRALIASGEVHHINENTLSYEHCGCMNFINYSDLCDYMSSPLAVASWFGSHKTLSEKDLLCEGTEEEITFIKTAESANCRVVSVNDTVITPAGEFADCVHIQFEGKKNKYDAWYHKNVGIVKSTTYYEKQTKVLSSYNIVGGEGWLPIAVGNSWNYVTPDKPDSVFEHHEFTVLRTGKDIDEGSDAVLISRLDYVALENEWEDSLEDHTYAFLTAESLCKEEKYVKAAELLHSVIIKNKDNESVCIAKALLDCVNERIEYGKNNWRVCPSSATICELSKEGDTLTYEASFGITLGSYGTRSEENRIFGVKPFRYLQELCGTLWSDKWIPGYTEDRPDKYHKDMMIHIKVTDGGTVVTPAGTFDNTIRLTIDFEVDGNHDDYFHYFYSNTETGLKEYWFAPGVGIVRHTCRWGKHMDSEALLTEYRAVAKDGEMFPFHVGNRWRYEEMNLTRENYIARFDCKILSGMNGKYIAAFDQMFTYKGTVEEYEEFKRGLAEG